LSPPEAVSALRPGPTTCQAEGTPNKLTVAQYRTDDFTELYRSGYPRLVAALRLAGATDGPDLAQEAFARTLRHWRRVRQGSNPAGYVTTTAFRLLRRHRLAPTVPLEDAHGAVTGPEAVTVAAISVHTTLAAMPARRRQAAVLCLYLEMSAEEAAEAMGVSPSTVRVQLHRARADLRAALADTPSGPTATSPVPGA